MELFDQIQEALVYIKNRTDFQPQYGIILGTGLGNLTDEIKIESEIPYENIPHFPTSTVQSHKGKLIFGHFAGKPIVAMAGRFHYYEGYTMRQVTFPVRVLKALGIKTLFISNAAGSTNANINTGDIVVIRDHINLQPENPLRGHNDERLGPRFPDMLYTYDRDLINRSITIAKDQGVTLHTGVYVGLQGPNLETPAEYNFINTIGGDVVGMSTVPEVLVARHSNLPVWVASVVSNKCFPLNEIKVTTVEDVIAVVQASEPKLRSILHTLISEL
jgi:purine-nucleoside phosphorylase